MGNGKRESGKIPRSGEHSSSAPSPAGFVQVREKRSGKCEMRLMRKCKRRQTNSEIMLSKYLKCPSLGESVSRKRDRNGKWKVESGKGNAHIPRLRLSYLHSLASTSRSTSHNAPKYAMNCVARLNQIKLNGRSVCEQKINIY